LRQHQSCFLRKQFTALVALLRTRELAGQPPITSIRPLVADARCVANGVPAN